MFSKNHLCELSINCIDSIQRPFAKFYEQRWKKSPCITGGRFPRVRVSNSIVSILNFPMYSANMGSAVLLIMLQIACKYITLENEISDCLHTKARSCKPTLSRKGHIPDNSWFSQSTCIFKTTDWLNQH